VGWQRAPRSRSCEIRPRIGGHRRSRIARSRYTVLARRKQCGRSMRIRVPQVHSFGAAALLLATRAMLPLGALLAAGALLSL